MLLSGGCGERSGTRLAVAVHGGAAGGREQGVLVRARASRVAEKDPRATRF